MENTLEMAIELFSFPVEEEQRLEQLRQEFVRLFPAERIANLTLQEYAVGLDPPDTSFCYWLEFKTFALGRIGGNQGALQHLVYFSKSKNKWIFDAEFKDENAAFEAVRKGILNLLALAREGRIEEIEQVTPFNRRRVTRGKILSLYFPDLFLPIFSVAHLQDFCRLLDIRDSDFESQVSMNRALLRFKQSHPRVKDWSNLGFANFLYAYFEPKREFWKIAPGDEARFWDECRDGSFICIGWDAMGDLSKLDDKEEFRQRFAARYPKNPRKWKELWDFAHIKEGDTIVANKGKRAVVGIGKATGTYWFDDSRAEYKHCIGVEWQNTDERPYTPQVRQIVDDWGFRTVKSLTREDVEALKRLPAQSRALPLWTRADETSFDLTLLDAGNVDTKQIGELLTRFMSTEHPQQPGFNEYLRGDLQRWVDDPTGPLTSAAYVTLSNWFLSNPPYSNSPRAEAAAGLWDALFPVRPKSRLSSSETGRNHVILPDAFREWWAEVLKRQGTPFTVITQTKPSPALARYKEIAERTFLPPAFFAECEELLQEKRQIIFQGAPGTGKTFVAGQLATLWAGSPERTKVVQFHESYGYEDFVFGIKPKVDDQGRTAFHPEQGLFLRWCEIARRGSPERYVLVIDEINRAKTARVFGELLYSLEYRDSPVELQSGSKFRVPDNLYIIGTMNTLDKSIALVDYALRRRFAFISLHAVQDGKSVVLRKWMDGNQISDSAEVDALFVALNEALAERDAGLVIGHSFFMREDARQKKRYGPEKLDFLWRYYVLPLVAEYEYQLSPTQIEDRYGLDAIRERASVKGRSAGV